MRDNNIITFLVRDKIICIGEKQNYRGKIK